MGKKGIRRGNGRKRQVWQVQGIQKVIMPYSNRQAEARSLGSNCTLNGSNPLQACVLNHYLHLERQTWPWATCPWLCDLGTPDRSDCSFVRQ